MRQQHTSEPDTQAERYIQTLARAYNAICRGEVPWVAVNEFFHEWQDYVREQRAALIADPLPPCVPGAAGPASLAFGNGHPDVHELWRWPVFCVAAAEYLCSHDSVPCPAWIRDPAYTLSEPWYGFSEPGATTARDAGLSGADDSRAAPPPQHSGGRSRLCYQIRGGGWYRG